MGQMKAVEKRWVATRMDGMPRKKLQWLWPERIALGTLTVLAGDYQSGKSLLAADLAARVSRGEAWPDGRAGMGPREVLLLSHEGNLQDALEMAGADMTRLVSLEEIEELSERGRRNKKRQRKDEGNPNDEELLAGVEDLGNEAGKRTAEDAESAETQPAKREDWDLQQRTSLHGMQGKLQIVKRRPINLQMDLDVLDQQLAAMEECRLVVIDPIDAHVTCGNTVVTRMWLRSLAMIAAKYQVAMVLVTGLKEWRKSPLNRLMGGLGLAGAARAVWAVVEDAREEVGGQPSTGSAPSTSSGQASSLQASSGQGRLLLGVKKNLSGERTGLGFRLAVDDGQGVPRVEWSTELVTETAEEVLEHLRQMRAKPSFAVSQAMEFLREALAEGPRLIGEVVAEAKEREGISRASLERARKVMGVRAFRKVIPGAWWIALKECGIGKAECGIDGVEVVGNEVGERNAEIAEDAEKVVEALDDVETLECVESVDGVGNFARNCEMSAGKGVERFDGVEGLGKNAANGKVFDEKMLAAMEVLVRAPERLGELDDQEQALLRPLLNDRERFGEYWTEAFERIEDIDGVEGLAAENAGSAEMEADMGTVGDGTDDHHAERDVNYQELLAKKIALRERRRKLAEKKRKMRKVRNKQRKMQRVRR